MKRFIFAFVVACLHLVPAQAQVNTCPALPQQVVVYFGNGINTDQRSARRSRDLLRDNLGTTYNNKTLRYDTAYNATDGMALDLVQAARQAGVQWDSDLANWLSRLELAPGWFVGWYQRQIEQRSLAFLPELDQHVDSYRNAISLGQRVLVVSHSQGNFYANEAKRFLTQRLTTEQMARFAIYGVAVPTNNIGGASGPYLTNHRDFISLIPDALAANFTLRRGAGGLPADDVGRIQAHLFNDTYLSDDFNIRPTLLQGVRAELDRFEAAPPANCIDEVRPYLASIGSGQFQCLLQRYTDEPAEITGSAGIRNGVFTINKTAGPFSGIHRFDVNHPDAIVYLQAGSIGEFGYNLLASRSYPQYTLKRYLRAGGEFGSIQITGDSEISHCGGAPSAVQMASGLRPLGEVVANSVNLLSASRRSVFEAGQCKSTLNGRLMYPVEVDVSTAGVRIGERFISWSSLPAEFHTGAAVEAKLLVPDPRFPSDRPDLAYLPLFSLWLPGGVPRGLPGALLPIIGLSANSLQGISSISIDDTDDSIYCFKPL